MAIHFDKRFFILMVLASISMPSNAVTVDSHLPRQALAPMDVPPVHSMDPKNVPDFINYNKEQSLQQRSNSSALQAGLQSATLPVQTRLTLVVEYPISASISQPGDIFEGHVKNDLFLGKTLILPRGSLVRGRVSDVLKPRRISRAGKIGLKLDQIVTPTGDVIPLDASLEFHKGVSNKQGQLDPGTSFGTRVQSSVKTVAGLNDKGSARGALVAANVATLGAPIVATALGSSAVALFRAGDDISLGPGQELEVLLTNDLGLQIN